MGSFIDLSGKTFGDWTVLEYLGRSQWKCQCNCGEVRPIDGSNLRSGRSKRCALCGGLEQQMIGKRFGRLVVTRQAESQQYQGPNGKSRYTRVCWFCDCDCGTKEYVVSGDHLRNQGTGSCGCLRSEAAKKKRTHGMTIDGPNGGQTHEYKIWARARRRASEEGLPFDLDPTDISIPEVCPVFHWPLEIGAGTSHDRSPSLDRIEPTKGYVKNNVWVISHLANRIKNNATLEQLEAVAAALRTKLL